MADICKKNDDKSKKNYCKFINKEQGQSERKKKEKALMLPEQKGIVETENTGSANIEDSLLSVVGTSSHDPRDKGYVDQINDLGFASLDDSMGQNAQAVNDILHRMNSQMAAEDELRKNLINFYNNLLVAIVVTPLALIIVMVITLKGKFDICSTIVALASLIQIPISIIGLMKSVAKNLFNDTYRSTVPAMIENIMKSLTNYNISKINPKEESADIKKKSKKEVHGK